VANYIFLDSGPLSLACKGQNNNKAVRCRTWIAALRAKGYLVIVPEITDYETRREFIRIPAPTWIAQLDAITATSLLPITRAAILKAAEFWALLRNTRMGTADPKELDCDAILAAQAITAAQLGDNVIIATDNIGHLSRFPGITAQPWEYIT
jgi:predicted nucleic acid-binding protein